MRLRKESLASFRGLVDGNDSFILNHGITSIRQNVKHVPEELKTKQGIQNLLLKAFPKLATDQKQRKQAGRWIRLIQLHYKYHYSERLTAEEMGLSHRTIYSIKSHIKRVLENRRLDGSGNYKRNRNATK